MTLKRIHADGSLSAPIALIGEAGGENEERIGRPFVGASGHKLNSWWHEVGLRRADFWIDNVFPFRPPHNDLASLLASDYLTVHEWAANLHDRIAALEDPKLIVTTGNIALRALMRRALDDTSITITKYRGSLLEYIDARGRSIKLIPTIHPASIYHQRAKKARGQEKSNPGRTEKHCKMDWARIARELSIPGVPRPEDVETYHVPWDDAELAWWREEVSRLDPSIPITIDIENPSGPIACVGFAWSPEASVTIPLRERGTPEDEAHPTFAARRALIEFICTTPNPKVLQNGPYDICHLHRQENITVVNYCYDLMEMHHVLDPCEDHDLAFMISAFLRRAYHKDEAKGDKAKKYSDSFAALCAYNGMDCCTQIALFYELQERLIAAGRWTVYEQCFKPVIPHLIAMMLGGMRTSRIERRIAGAQLRARTIEIQDELARVAGRRLHAKKGLSRKLCMEYIYGELKLPVQRKRGSKDKPGAVTLDEVAKRKLQLRFPAPHPAGTALGLMLEHERIIKLASFLTDSKTDDDGYLRSEIRQLTETGRCSSKKNPFGTGCLPGDAEVLTPHGWLRLDDFSVGKIMQYDPETAELSFETATQYVTEFSGELVRADSWFHRANYTPGHRIGVDVERNRNKVKTVEWVVEHAADVAERSVAWMPTSGEYDGFLHICAPLIRLIVATQADGSIEGSVIRFAFKKKRKIERLLKLADDVGITLSEQSAQAGYRRFCIRSRDAEPIIRRLGAAKLYDRWLLDCDANTLEAFIDETQYWDATIRGQSWMYFTTHERNAEWVQTVVHLTNRRATRRVVENRRPGSYGEHSAKPLHTVAIRPVATARLTKKHWSTVSYDGPVYCAQTATGFFLVRSEGTIFVTGNTNLQNQDRDERVRSSFVPDHPDHILLEVDCSQAESRIVYVLSGDDDLYNMAILPPDRFDTHSYNARLIFGASQTKTDTHKYPVTDVDLVTKLGYVTYEQRYFGKRVEHGAQRGMGGETMSNNLLKDGEIRTPEECDRMLKQYHLVKPGVGRYFEWVRGLILRERALTNSWGFRWDVRHEKMDQELYRRAYSFLPQSEVAFILNTWGVATVGDFIAGYYRPRDARLLTQVHDSVLISCVADVDVVLSLLTVLWGSLTQERVYQTRVGPRALSMPIEAKIGPNWGFPKDQSAEWKALPSREAIAEALARRSPKAA